MSNRLAWEKSPYLLQHAENPVDWYPWGEEAFALARGESKPIFLSIGYATCHWCHVMERESFSKPAVAAVLNRHFVAIKVDREERPDVDRVYMAAVQAMTGAGGWPLNVFLTPELTPFFGGTYFPPEPHGGLSSFTDILETIARSWAADRENIVSSSRRLGEEVSRYLTASKSGSTTISTDLLDNAFGAFKTVYDPVNGGFNPSPKFPMPVNLNFLLRYHARAQKQEALDMVVHTLRRMAAGGLCDQLGGGFHRYSTDSHWHLPHFEKTLYDNAQLAVNYLEAGGLANAQDLTSVARNTLRFVRQEMTLPDGGFASALDADSPEDRGEGGASGGFEGAYYLWDWAEIRQTVGEAESDLFCRRFGVLPQGNTGPGGRGEMSGKNVFFVARTLKELSQEFNRSERFVGESLRVSLAKLKAVRDLRPPPLLDDKVIASWNGLMISAFAKAAWTLDDPEYLKTAVRAAHFVITRMYDSEGKRLFHRWRDGERVVSGMAEDYAFLARGLLDLYAASFDPRWLNTARELMDILMLSFSDDAGGRLFMTQAGHESHLLARVTAADDNVEPSANSVAAQNLLRLSVSLERDDYRRAGERILSVFAEPMARRPRTLPEMLVALDAYLSENRRILIAGDPAAPDTGAFLRQARRRCLPNDVLMILDGGPGQRALSREDPFLGRVAPRQGKATAYVCTGNSCRTPTSDLGVFLQELKGSEPALTGRLD